MSLALATLAAVVYGLGWRRPLRVVGVPWRWTARHWQAVAFAAGLLLLVASVSQPADAVARLSLWTRTVQLIVLVMVVAPLLVVGSPASRVMRLLGIRGGGGGGGRRGPAVTAFVFFNGMLWLAYFPPVYAATANPGFAREVGQTAMLGVAVLFWAQVIDQTPQRCGLSMLERAAYLFLASAQTRILALVLGFASAPFYPAPLAEQQMAAGILLVPGVLTDTIVLLACLYLWLKPEESHSRRKPHAAGY